MIEPKAPKPRYGDPCNGCGLCCLRGQCPLSLALFGARKLCPALVDAGTTFRCGLMTETAQHFDVPEETLPAIREGVTVVLGIESECDSAFGAVDELRVDVLGPSLQAKWRAGADSAYAAGTMEPLRSYVQGLGVRWARRAA